MSVCQINKCRYACSHTTVKHCCGKCGQLGHGQIECGHPNLIAKLEKYKNDVINTPCSISKCIDPHTHTSNGHTCLYCDSLINSCGHTINCPEITGIISDNIDDFNKEISNYAKSVSNLNNNEYTSRYAGMGCTWYIRNNDGKYEYLFMHSDSWGQYGKDTSDLPRYKAFIYEYKKVM